MCWLSDLFKKKEEKAEVPKPKIDRYQCSALIISDELAGLGIESLYGRLDRQYFFTNLEDWGQILQYIYLTQELPKYSVDHEGKWDLDCEDWALWLKAMVSLHFGLNCCAFIIGDIPQSKHGYNLLKAGEQWYVWEPNPGFQIEEPFDIGEHGYKPLHCLV